MMIRIFTAALLFVCSFSTIAQEVKYKVSKDISWKLVSTIDFSENFEDLQIENHVQAAPKPYSNTQKLKEELNAKRRRKFTKLHKTYEIKDAGVSINPQLDKDFNGMPRGGGGVPNDNNMAISNSGAVVSVINSTITMMDDTGGVMMFRSLRSVVRNELPDLNRTFDPKIIYDPLNDRFILVFLQGSTSQDTRIITGFSQSNDPTKIWNFYAVDGNPFQGVTWSDYPIVGMNEEDFFITVNILRDGESWQEGFEQSVIWQINKESGYTGKATLDNRLFHDLEYNNRPIWSICIVPIGDWQSNKNETTGPHMHFLSVRPDARLNDTLFVQTIYGSVASNTESYDVRARTTSKPYGVPPSAFQSEVGYRLETNDTRVLSAFEQDGVIQYVQSSIVPETGMPGIFHGVFRVNDTEQVEANYIQSDTQEYAYPSIAYVGDELRNMASIITFSHSSELDFPGTSAVHYNALKGFDRVYSQVIPVKQGEGLINTFLADSIERWGDYTAVQRKYNEKGVAWLCGSHGRLNNTVGTWIGKLVMDPTMRMAPTLENLLLFPNPVDNEVNLIVEVATKQTLKFNIYDLNGKLLVEMGSYSLEDGVNAVRLNMDDMRLKSLLPGMYLFTALTESGERLSSQRFFTQ
jgi:hypothetical protein